MPTYPTYKLSEIARSTKGKKPKSVSKEKTDGFEIPYVDIKAFEKGIVDNYTDGENCTFCKPDDVLIVWDGARCGFVGRGVEGAIGSTLAKISSDKYTNDFLFYFLQSKYKVLNSNPRGVGIPHIEPNLLWNFEIPNVDKTTQHAIVTRIETLFTELDKAVQHLRTAQQQLKTYRQAVLNHWLNNEEGKWEMVKLGEVAEIKRGRSKHRPRNDKSLFGGKYPFIQTGEIREAKGGTITTYTQTYSEKGLEQSRLWPKGTLCLTIAANIAETAYLGFDACFPDSVVGILAQEDKLSLDYFNFFIQLVKQEIENKASATAQKNINVDFLENLNISLPPLAEQQRIVKEIESRLSQATASETYIENALQQAEALRQSILKKAFSGELV